MPVERPPLRYLPAADVEAAMPPIDERLALADLTLRSLVADAELPAKIAVHPRPPSSFAHAIPAYLRGPLPDGRTDRLGMKWVIGYPANVDAGLAAIHGLVLLNDPATGLPTAILDAAPITAQRTAAVSGVAIRAFRPAVDDRPPRVAVVGTRFSATLCGRGGIFPSVPQLVKNEPKGMASPM